MRTLPSLISFALSILPSLMSSEMCATTGSRCIDAAATTSSPSASEEESGSVRAQGRVAAPPQ